MNWALAILLLVFFGGGIFLFLGALATAVRTLRIRWSGLRREGVIVKASQGEWRRATLERHRSEGRQVWEIRRPDSELPIATELIWTLTIEFEDAAGAKQQGTTQAGTRKRPYEIGERIPMWYDPKDPSAIRIDSFVELWGAPLLLGMFGAAFLVIGLLLSTGAIALR